MNQQKIKAAVSQLKGMQPLETIRLTQLTQKQDCRPCGDKKRRQCTYCMSLSYTGMQKIQNLGLYVLDTQGYGKHEGEWPKA